ncbi:MAG: hypothetical protein JWN52_7041 [Actinomycetia bacterium]|nr:hypothetical protein [Actinomycetes bacterium]
MRRLARRRHRKPDQGAVTSLMAILLSGSVLVGMSAVVVDMGQIYTERQELQSGADASAISLASSCGTTGCDLAAAQTYADANASDGRSDIQGICGSGPGLSACGAPKGNLTDCTGTRPASGNYVEVHTSTRTAGDKTVLPPRFARALLGSGYQDITVRSCARAVWGTPAKVANAFGLGISECAFNAATNDGTEFTPADQIKSGNEDAWKYEKWIYDWNFPGFSNCGSHNLGWLNPPSGCFQQVSTGQELDGHPSTSFLGYFTSTICKTYSGFNWLMSIFFKSYRKPVYLPIYKDNPTCDSFGTCKYQIVGFAYFVTSGYLLDLFNESPSWRSAWLCNVPIIGAIDPCIMGFFGRGTVSGPIGSGPDMGVRVVELAG